MLSERCTTKNKYYTILFMQNSIKCKPTYSERKQADECLEIQGHWEALQRGKKEHVGGRYVHYHYYGGLMGVYMSNLIKFIL